MPYKIKIEPEALADIQSAIDWYNEQQSGLGKKYHAEVKRIFKILKSNPVFPIRYDEVRCLPLKKFPFMIHYTLNPKSKLIIVRAVFHTSRNSEIWKERK